MLSNIKLIVFSYEHFTKPIIAKANPTRTVDFKMLQCVFAALAAMRIKFVLTPEKPEMRLASSSDLFLLSGRHPAAETMPWYNNYEQLTSLKNALRYKNQSLDIAVCEFYGKQCSTTANETLLVSRGALASAIHGGFSTIYLHNPTLLEYLFEILWRVNGHEIALKLDIDPYFKSKLHEYLADKDKKQAGNFIALLETLVQRTCPPARWFSSQPHAKDTVLAALLEQSKASAHEDLPSLLAHAAYICSIDSNHKRWFKKRNVHLLTLTELLNSQLRFHQYRNFIREGMVTSKDVADYGKQVLEDQLGANTQRAVKEPKSVKGYVMIQ